MTSINVILIAVGSFLTFLWFKFTKPSGVNNDKTTQGVKNLQDQVTTNNTVITQIQKDANDEKAKPSTTSDDAKFFNDRKS